MGILGRINTVIKSNLNEIMDKMTDPAKEIDLLIVEMEEDLKQAKTEVIAQTAASKRAGMHCDGLQQDVDRWQKRAEQAVGVGDDDLARQALERRMKVETDLAGAQKQHEEQIAYAGQLKESLKVLERRLKEIKLGKESLKAKAKALKERQGELSGGGAFEDFQRLEDKIQAMEEEGQLTAGLDGKDAAIEAKFALLESKDPQVEDALAALKRKMDDQ